MSYPKFRITEIEKIQQFCKNKEINFVQWVTGGDREKDRIYLCKAIGKTCYREAKILFDFDCSLHEAVEILEKIKEENAK